ncbi:MAG: quinone oxidoreductase family protein, partial [Verrucomicrobiales bacterium]
GAHVIATGSTGQKREFALSLGANHVVDSTNPSWPAEVRKLTGKRGVDLVLEHVGGKVLEQCFNCLARGGTVVTCGATAGKEVQMNLWPFFVKEQRLIGSYGRNRQDLRNTLNWASLGRLRPLVHQTYPLNRTSDAFQRLRDRSVLGKIVVTI